MKNKYLYAYPTAEECAASKAEWVAGREARIAEGVRNRERRERDEARTRAWQASSEFKRLEAAKAYSVGARERGGGNGSGLFLTMTLVFFGLTFLVWPVSMALGFVFFMLGIGCLSAL